MRGGQLFCKCQLLRGSEHAEVGESVEGAERGNQFGARQHHLHRPNIADDLRGVEARGPLSAR